MAGGAFENIGAGEKILLVFGFMTIILVVLWIIIDLSFIVTARNLGVLDDQTKYIITVYLFSIVLLPTSLYTIHKTIFGKSRQINWWFWGTICIILFSIFPGLLAINNIVGIDDELNLHLNENGMQTKYMINCSYSGPVLANKDVICFHDLDFDLRNVSNSVIITFKNGTDITQNFENYSFYSHGDASYVLFQINGLDNRNESRNLSSGWRYKFMTISQHAEAQKNFVNLVLAFFGAILFAVPYTISNLKQIAEKSK